jgi:hypothetical protein
MTHYMIPVAQYFCVHSHPCWIRTKYHRWNSPGMNQVIFHFEVGILDSKTSTDIQMSPGAYKHICVAYQQQKSELLGVIQWIVHLRTSSSLNLQLWNWKYLLRSRIYWTRAILKQSSHYFLMWWFDPNIHS